MEIDRTFLERTLSAMEGVIDVADRKTDEFEEMRACIMDLTLMLHRQPQQQTDSKDGGVPVELHEKIKWGAQTYGPLLRAAIDLLAAVDARHEESGVMKYTIPYGAVNALREAINSRPQQQPGKPRGNIGHGHVFPRPDGVKARCGGPALCNECARDESRKMD